MHCRRPEKLGSDVQQRVAAAAAAAVAAVTATEWMHSPAGRERGQADTEAFLLDLLLMSKMVLSTLRPDLLQFLPTVLPLPGGISLPPTFLSSPPSSHRFVKGTLFYFIIVLVVRGVSMWRSEDNSEKSVLSYLIGSRYQTQLIRQQASFSY